MRKRTYRSATPQVNIPFLLLAQSFSRPSPIPGVILPGMVLEGTVDARRGTTMGDVRKVMAVLREFGVKPITFKGSYER